MLNKNICAKCNITNYKKYYHERNHNSDVKVNDVYWSRADESRWEMGYVTCPANSSGADFSITNRFPPGCHYKMEYLILEQKDVK